MLLPTTGNKTQLLVIKLDQMAGNVECLKAKILKTRSLSLYQHLNEVPKYVQK